MLEAIDVLADTDVGTLVRGALGVTSTRALSRTCKTLHALLEDQLAQWMVQLRNATREEGLAHKDTTFNLALEGHFALLKWLRHSSKFRLDEQTFAGAAWFGNLEVLKWLHSEGCPWDANACMEAAGGGHLEVLKWLRANECPWDEEACANAAKFNNLEVLKWLHSNGCPWDEGARIESFESMILPGGEEVWEYLLANGCPSPRWEEEEGEEEEGEEEAYLG